MKIAYRLRSATLEGREFMMHLERVNLEPYPKIMEPFDEKYQKHYYESLFRPKHVSNIEYNNRPIGALSVVIRRKDISLIKKMLKYAQKEHKPLITSMLKEETHVKQMFDDFGFEIFMENDLRYCVKWIPPQ